MTPEELIAENHYLREQLADLQEANAALNRELERMYDEEEWDDDYRPYQGYYPSIPDDSGYDTEEDWDPLVSEHRQQEATDPQPDMDIPF